MADVLLNIDEASKQLQLSKDQIAEMVKKGLLRGFLDQKTYKFRPADIEAFKKKLASGATTLSEGAPKTDAVPARRRDATSKIDLTEVESDSGVEDTDQTSVLAPVSRASPKKSSRRSPCSSSARRTLSSTTKSRRPSRKGTRLRCSCRAPARKRKARQRPSRRSTSRKRI